MIISKGKRWQDLTQAQRMATVIMGLVQVSLLAAALYDIHQRSDDELTASKGAWTAISFINFLGPLAYFLFGRKK
jgi:drug/metabolite transporter (DMT)-like permease